MLRLSDKLLEVVCRHAGGAPVIAGQSVKHA